MQSDEQLGLVTEAVSGTDTTPLFLRLVYDFSLQWRSWDTGMRLPGSDVPGMIEALFERLETDHGSVFVASALRSVTAAIHGLSDAEVVDAVTLDDEALRSVFEWWSPPFPRLPPALWVRLRADLGAYLVERGAQGVSVLRW